AKWGESFEQRTDPQGRNYFWMTGEFMNLDAEKESTDERALENGYISVVPCHFDLTAYKAISSLSRWDLNEQHIILIVTKYYMLIYTFELTYVADRKIVV